MLELTGLAVGALTYRKARTRPVLLRAAILAQIFDLVTLSFVLAHYAVESNPIARVMLDAIGPLKVLLGYDGVLWVGLVGLIGIKLGLIAYLDWIAPHLGRYRRIVLSVAVAVGILGAASNLVTALPQFIPA